MKVIFKLFLICSLVLTSGSVYGIKKDKYLIISRGKNSGAYKAVPDACRLKNGDIVAVYYDGNNHVTFPDGKYPKAGRICLVRSKDEGRTWSEPVSIYDDIHDNRDPHIVQLSDGSLICSFFSLTFDIPEAMKKAEEPAFTKEQTSKFGNNPDLLKEQKPSNQEKEPPRKWKGWGPFVIKSFDNGETWENEATHVSPDAPGWYCSSKVREMPDGTCYLPVYYSEAGAAWGGVIPSTDKGKTWGKVIEIGKEANLILAAETDIILLKDQSLYAALRGDGSKVNMHYSKSIDMGRSWNPVKDIGFVGHCPSFTRLNTGEILLSIRAHSVDKGFYTGLRVSHDEGTTWEGPYQIDEKVGGYPSTVELTDGSVLVIYYEEGENSAIRALRFRKPKPANGKIFTDPEPVKTLFLK